MPIVLLFMVLGMVAGSESIGGIAFEDYGMAFRLGTAALVFILFDDEHLGGRGPLRSGAGLRLATLGVALTAGIVALGGRLVGLDWLEALLLGARGLVYGCTGCLFGASGQRRSLEAEGRCDVRARVRSQ